MAEREWEYPAALLAQTGYRLYHQLLAGVLPWDQLGEGTQDRWLRAAAWFQGSLESLDGQPWSQVACLLGEKLAPEHGLHSVPAKVWEAIGRYWNRLCDEDGPVEDLEAEEASWNEWYQRGNHVHTA